MDPFVKKVQNFIFHEHLFAKGDGIVVGISGGPDSVCLVRVLHALQNKYNLNISLLHVNYGLRGKDSSNDEKFVRTFAEKLGLPLKVVAFLGQENKDNLEDSLRIFRYCELEKRRKLLKYQKIAVAHTMDDQAETFLMNLMRGAGLLGLGGMQSKKDHVIRPLLGMEKKDIVKYLELCEQKYRIDKSNFDQDLFRNKIRLKILPILQKEFGKTVKDRINNAAMLAQELNLFVEKKTEKSYNKIVAAKDGGARFLAKEFLELEKALQGYVFRKICQNVGGDLRNITRGHFVEFLKIILSEKSKRQKFVFGSIVVERRGEVVVFCKKNN